MSIKIGLLAGEPSGDNLAAGLMAALHDQAPTETIKFIGVGGPAMIAQGPKNASSLRIFSGQWF
ncbi:MAG: hypothetical protein CM15mP120_22440 [Pseudomonadota bacterium]|nr:MAG: hypothetical protein CM15mP120_22440 [Pseudomonadota bacterium]